MFTHLQITDPAPLPICLPHWQAPWHAHLLPLGPQVQAGWEQFGSAHAALNALPNQAGVRFAPQAALPAGVAYEQFIFDTQQVPTRDNLHDFFNGLMWLHFPRTKLRLNALQAAELARMGGVHATRGAARDALTLFDENVALLQAPDALWQALAHKRWGELFGPLRPLWGASRLVLFGHATLEQLVQPFKGITAHVYRVPQAVAALDDPHWLPVWDDWLAHDLTVETLSARPKPFAHLPVLGVPGWWPANAEPGFYEDATVFRPLRRHGPVAPVAA